MSWRAQKTILAACGNTGEQRGGGGRNRALIEDRKVRWRHTHAAQQPCSKSGAALTEDERVEHSKAQLLNHLGNQVGDHAVQPIAALAARGRRTRGSMVGAGASNCCEPKNSRARVELDCGRGCGEHMGRTALTGRHTKRELPLEAREGRAARQPCDRAVSQASGLSPHKQRALEHDGRNVRGCTKGGQRNHHVEHRRDIAHVAGGRVLAHLPEEREYNKTNGGGERASAVRCGEAAAQAILGSTDGVVKTGAELAAALSTPAATASASCSRMDELVSNSGGQEVQVAVVLGGAVL